MRPRTLVICGLVVAACAATPAPAGAATVSLEFVERIYLRHDQWFDDHRLVYAAETGEVNRPVVTLPESSHFRVRVADSGAPLVPGPGCESEPGGSVICRPSAPAGEIHTAAIDLGDRDDALLAPGLSGAVAGGPGADELHTTAGSWRVDGGDGADVMRTAGCCADVLYSTRTAPVRVTPGAGADDGEAGEGDDVGAGYVGIVGGAGGDELHARPGGEVEGREGDDRLLGSNGGELLDGGPGDDSVEAGPGDDALLNGPGGDRIRGGEGSDLLTYQGSTPVFVALDDSGGDGAKGEGDDVRDDVENVTTGSGPDVLVGSAAANRLEGNGGGDRIEGGPGDDVLSSEEGPANRLVGDAGLDSIFAAARDRVEAADGARDRIVCGDPGTARLVADATDAARGCAPVVSRAGPKRIRAARDGVVRMRVRCPAIATVRCTGSLRPRETVFDDRLGTGEYRNLRPGAARTVAIRLTPAARRLIERRGSVSVHVVSLARRAVPRSSLIGDFPAILMRPR